MLRLEAKFSQNSVLCGEPGNRIQLLIRLTPQANTGLTSRHRANLALLIDNSSSMRGADRRIELAIAAAKNVVNLLDTDDILTVIAFWREAKVVLPATRVDNPARLNKAIESIIELDGYGTDIAAGMETALIELRRHFTPHGLNRALLLTDGNTVNAHRCEQIAAHEARNGLAFSTFGLGYDWNTRLLRSIADQGGGRWHYLSGPYEIEPAFKEELGMLLSAIYSNVRLKLQFFQPDTIRQVRLVSPEIKDLTPQSDSDDKNDWEIFIGSMPKKEQYNLLLELQLTPRKPGCYNLMSQISLSYDLPNQPNQDSVGQVPMLDFVTDAGQIKRNTDVSRWLNQIEIDNLVRQATNIEPDTNNSEARRLLEEALERSRQQTDGQKSQILENALEELNRGGISRKTQLEALDQARKTKHMPD